MRSQQARVRASHVDATYYFPRRTCLQSLKQMWLLCTDIKFVRSTFIKKISVKRTERLKRAFKFLDAYPRDESIDQYVVFSFSQVGGFGLGSWVGERVLMVGWVKYNMMCLGFNIR